MNTLIVLSALVSVAFAIPPQVVKYVDNYGPELYSAPIITKSYAEPTISYAAPVISKSYAVPIAEPIYAKSYAAPAISYARGYGGYGYGGHAVSTRYSVRAAPVYAKSYAQPIYAKSYAQPIYTKSYAAPAVYSAPILTKAYAEPTISYAAPILTKSYAAPIAEPIYGKSIVNYGLDYGYGKVY